MGSLQITHNTKKKKKTQNSAAESYSKNIDVDIFVYLIWLCCISSVCDPLPILGRLLKLLFLLTTLIHLKFLD